MYNSDSKGGSIFKYSSTACNDILIKDHSCNIIDDKRFKAIEIRIVTAHSTCICHLRSNKVKKNFPLKFVSW